MYSHSDRSQNSTETIPTPQLATELLEEELKMKVMSIERFTTGLSHFVYDVTTTTGDKYVVRIAHRNNENFKGALYWYPLLLSKNVPLREILYADEDGKKYGFPAMILKRLNGSDLGVIYDQLSLSQKHKIVDEIISMQSTVGTLPPISGFGYVDSHNDTSMKNNWLSVLIDKLEQAEKRIIKSDIINTKTIQQMKKALYLHQDYFEQIESVAFLDDITTKNVIVNNEGKLSGIVDVDWVTFGDPLLTVALTRMSLFAMKRDTEYTDYWLEKINPNDAQKRAMDLYTALFAIEFISEKGHKFNKAKTEPVNTRDLALLVEVFRSMIKLPL